MSWCEAIIPLAVEVFSLQCQGGKFFIGHFNFGGIDVRVEHGFHNKPFRRCRAGDQIHNRLPIDEWLTSPVLSDKAEQAMLRVIKVIEGQLIGIIDGQSGARGFAGA